MVDPIPFVACIVGIIGCFIGVATFIFAQMTKAKQYGELVAKVDYLVKSFDEQKKEMKDRNTTLDKVIDEHSVIIVDIQARLRNVEKKVFNETRG